MAPAHLNTQPSEVSATRNDNFLITVKIQIISKKWVTMNIWVYMALF